MRVVLAEKPSVARELASFLGAGERRDGYFEGRGYQVTWALGHLATLKEPQDYDPALKTWSLATLPIIPERFELKAVGDRGAGKQLAIVKRLFRAADEIICATDAGREGELIFRYILELSGLHGQSRPGGSGSAPSPRPRSGTPSPGSGLSPTTTTFTPRPGAGARPTGSSA